MSRIRLTSFQLPRNSDLTFVAASERIRYSVQKLKTKQTDSFDRVAFRPPLPIDQHPQILPPQMLPPLAAGPVTSMSRSELIELLPEGLAGEGVRELLLQGQKTEATLEHVARRESVEIMAELRTASGNGTRSILLDGKRGVGKSAILNFIVAKMRKTEAAENKFVVIFEPHPSRYMKEVSEIFRTSTGNFVQNSLAQKFLDRLGRANGEKLAAIPVRPDIYGKTALDGCSSQEYLKRGFLPLAEKMTGTLPALRPGEGAAALRTRLLKIAEILEKEIEVPSMKRVLREPRNLMELVEFGLSEEGTEYAQQTVYEIVAQLKEQTKFCVLFVVDEFNETLPVSEFVSHRYDNTRFNGYIPGYHLGMARLFTRPIRFKRGINLFATSWRARNRRDFRPELLGFKAEDVKTVREFTSAEFRLFAASLSQRGILHPKFALNEDMNYWFMASQGNPWQARKLLTTLF